MLKRPPFARRPWLALLLLSPSLALAEEATTLPTTQISGAAVQEALPTTTTTDAETLDKRFIRSFEDLGRRGEPGVNFNRNSESINIRGLDRDRILTTIDGIRVPWMTDGARSQGPTGGAQGGLDAFDFNALSSVDIVRGSNSSQVGSGALGGAVQLFTLNPEDLLTDGKDFGSLAKTDYDSADHSWGLNAALAGRIHNTYWLLQGGQRRGHEQENTGSDDLYGNRRTKTNPADSKQQSLLVKLQQRFDGGHRVGFTGELFNRDRDIDSRSNQGTTYLIGQNSTEEHVRRQRLSLDYDYKAEGNSLLDSAQAILYWQKLRRNDDLNGVRSEVAPDGRAFIPAFAFFPYGLTSNPYAPFAAGFPDGPFGRNNQIEKELYGISGNLGKTVKLAGVPNKLTLGGELYQLNTEQASAGYDNCPDAIIPAEVINDFGPTGCSFLHSNQADMPKAEGRQWALYLTDEISFANGRFKLTPGVRYDAYKQKPQPGGDYTNNINPNNITTLNDSEDSKLSASLLATWQVTDAALIYAQWAQGFKAPDATQLYMNYGAPGTYLRLGNPDLKPEESNGYEVGLQLGNQSLGGSISLFDNRYKNFIDDNVGIDAASVGLDPDDYAMGVSRTENRSKVRIYGAESTAHWTFVPGWRVWGSLAWAVGKDLKTNQHLNSVAPLTTTLGLSYEREQYGADLMLTAARARAKVETDNDFQAPGYGVVDLTGYWNPVGVDGVRLQAGVFNLLDKKYWNALNVPDVAANSQLVQPDDYYSEAGRSFRVSASLQY